MNIYQIMTYYVICALLSGFFGYAIGSTEVRDPVKVMFELCGNGAPLVKDGKMYMVVCVPMRIEE